MKNLLLFGLIVLILLSGCNNQIQEEPEEIEEPESTVTLPITYSEPLEPEISAKGEIKKINYIYTSSTYGGFIESVDFEITNMGKEPIVVSVDYTIVDLSEKDTYSMNIMQGLGGGIIPIANLESGETKLFAWQTPKQRIRTGHNYKIQLTINDVISKKELVVLEKTQILPCSKDC